GAGALRDLHSFPTRRSSDLGEAAGVADVALQALALVLEVRTFDQRLGAELLELAPELFDQLVGFDGRVAACGNAGFLSGGVVLVWVHGHPVGNGFSGQFRPAAPAGAGTGDDVGAGAGNPTPGGADPWPDAGHRSQCRPGIGRWLTPPCRPWSSRAPGPWPARW